MSSHHVSGGASQLPSRSVISREAMSRRDPRALLLVILTLVVLVLLGELQGIERPVRLFRLQGAGV
jgi:hypothetical protein